MNLEEKTLDEAITELKEYIRADGILRENRQETDFEFFCAHHCKAIQLLLDAVESARKDC